MAEAHLASSTARYGALPVYSPRSWGADQYQ
jgi:hypothetical protein